MGRSFLSVAAAVLLAGSLAEAEEGWVIERLDIQLAIQPSGSIAAAEALDVDFRGLERHGIFRDIVSLLAYDGATNRRYDINLGAVTDADGRRYPVQTMTGGIDHAISHRRSRSDDLGQADVSHRVSAWGCAERLRRSRRVVLERHRQMARSRSNARSSM